MQEGVVIEIRWAGDSLAEKINAGVAYYLSLEENQKISGGVIAEKMSSGKISAHYEDANHYNSLD